MQPSPAHLLFRSASVVRSSRAQVNQTRCPVAQTPPDEHSAYLQARPLTTGPGAGGESSRGLLTTSAAPAPHPCYSLLPALGSGRGAPSGALLAAAVLLGDGCGRPTPTPAASSSSARGAGDPTAPSAAREPSVLRGASATRPSLRRPRLQHPRRPAGGAGAAPGGQAEPGGERGCGCAASCSAPRAASCGVNAAWV